MQNIQIQIENRGKVSIDRYELTIKWIENIIYGLGSKFSLEKFDPKMIYILPKEELSQEESLGFSFTLFSNLFKGHVAIKKIKGEELFNIAFYRRLPTKIRFTYKLSKSFEKVGLYDIIKQFNFVVIGENNHSIKIGNVYLLKNGLIAIVKKYYSNDKIGVVFDEFAPNIEEYISVEDLDSLIREVK